jgi:hypothetical protein
MEKKAATLTALTDRVREAALRVPHAKLWKTAQKLDHFVFLAKPRRGAPPIYKSPKEWFKDAKALVAAIEAATPEACAIAFPLLVRCDDAAALPLFMEFLSTELEGLETHVPSRALLFAFSDSWALLGPRVPARTMAKLFVAGRVRLGALDDEQLAVLSIADLVAGVRRARLRDGDTTEAKRVWTALARAPARVVGELWLEGHIATDAVPEAAISTTAPAALVKAIGSGVLGYLHRDAAERVIGVHPALEKPAARMRLLEAIVTTRSTHASCAFGIALISELAAARHRPLLPVLRRLRTHRDFGGSAMDALIALADRETLQALADGLATRAAKLKPRFDLHHTTPELRDPIRAVYALDPAASASAFAPYFTKKALARDWGAKIAADILMLGQGLITDHRGTKLGAGGGNMIARDPSWRDVLAELVGHPRLGPLAKSLLRVRK